MARQNKLVLDPAEALDARGRIIVFKDFKSARDWWLLQQQEHDAVIAAINAAADQAEPKADDISDLDDYDDLVAADAAAIDEKDPLGHGSEPRGGSAGRHEEHKWFTKLGRQALHQPGGGGKIKSIAGPLGYAKTGLAGLGEMISE
jgi:hypothetical protein